MFMYINENYIIPEEGDVDVIEDEVTLECTSPIM